MNASGSLRFPFLLSGREELVGARIGHSLGHARGARRAENGHSLIVAALQANRCKVLLNGRGQQILNANGARLVVAHGNQLHVQLGRGGLDLLVFIAIAKDELGLGYSEKLLNGALHIVNVERVEGDAIEDTGVDDGGYMRRIPGYNAHNIRLMQIQVAHVAGDALGIQEELLTGQRRVFRNRDLKYKQILKNQLSREYRNLPEQSAVDDASSR